jgi:quinoprotein glucose dehydrogenase
MSHSYRAADWAALILGGLMTVFGLILAGGGTWLLFLGGSFYYLSAGIALIVSGCLLIRRRVEGAWLYLLLFLLTLVWSWWEVGANGWALVPRAVGPALLLIAVLALAPKLRPYRYPYELPTTVGAGVLLLFGTALVMIGPFGKVSAAVGIVAPQTNLTMADPSPLKTGADWPAYGGSYSARR